jgi:hypothetical protein
VKKLATMLEMKDVVLEALARQCGISAELLDFVRLNADRITELMRSSESASNSAQLNPSNGAAAAAASSANSEKTMPKEKKAVRKNKT